MRAALSLIVLATACGPGSKDGECSANMLAGDLVITEVFADAAGVAGGTGADEGKEWIEIYNASDRPLTLKGMTIVHSRPDGSKQSEHLMDDVTVAPGQFFTMGNSTQDLLPAYIDYGYSGDLGDLFNSDGGKVALKCTEREIDSATYDGVKTGHSRELTASQPPDYTLNDDLANWCEGKDTQFEDGNFGTPGQDNDCTPVVIGQCTDGSTMRDTVGPGAGDLVITEVMPNPTVASATNGEWFEARVMRDVDLNGVGLDRAGDTAKPNLIESAACVRVTAGSTVVFAKTADSLLNGGLPTAMIGGTFKFAMIAGTVAAPGDIQILSGTTIVDAISWTRSATGKALQLDPDVIDPTSNDNPSNFCDATTAYNTPTPPDPPDLGTPGTENTQCALQPPAGMCIDGATIRPIVKPAAGALVITEFMPNPDGDDPVQEWFEIINASGTAFDLNDLGLDREGDTVATNVIRSPDCKSVAPGAFALFARSTDPAQNDMLPAVDATFSFSLITGTATTPGNIQILDDTTVIDKVTWTTSGADVSRQLDPDQTTQTGNDVEANFCPGTTAYGATTNKGTPKAANVQCP
jgi:hypothetical protein